MHKNFKGVEKTTFGRGSFNQLGSLLEELRGSKNSQKTVLIVVDHYFKDKPLAKQIPSSSKNKVLFIDVSQHEPTTDQVDDIRDRTLTSIGLPLAVVGIGGGSILDIAKAVSLMLKQEGSSVNYQGLNLIKNPGVYHIGIPTLSGTGAEVSMTAVLSGPEKKLGLKCDWTVFNQIILDPELTDDVPKEQWFYTGMDTFIHCIESQNGLLNNAYSQAYAKQALHLCDAVFLNKNSGQTKENSDLLMVASLMGGLSLTYSEVGVCHALSYGLSKILGLRHGYANCIAFNHLEDYYPEGVGLFRKMTRKHQITLPDNLADSWTDDQIASMAAISYELSHMWHHALGTSWKEVISLQKIETLFRRM